MFVVMPTPILFTMNPPILSFPSGFPHVVPHSILRSVTRMGDRRCPPFLLKVSSLDCFAYLYIEEYTRNWQLFSISVIITRLHQAPLSTLTALA